MILLLLLFVSMTMILFVFVFVFVIICKQQQSKVCYATLSLKSPRNIRRGRTQIMLIIFANLIQFDSIERSLINRAHSLKISVACCCCCYCKIIVVNSLINWAIEHHWKVLCVCVCSMNISQEIRFGNNFQIASCNLMMFVGSSSHVVIVSQCCHCFSHWSIAMQIDLLGIYHTNAFISLLKITLIHSLSCILLLLIARSNLVLISFQGIYNPSSCCFDCAFNEIHLEWLSDRMGRADWTRSCCRPPARFRGPAATDLSLSLSLRLWPNFQRILQQILQQIKEFSNANHSMRNI